jgi:YegS/Rv2252/BmrU family lipid kinase
VIVNPVSGKGRGEPVGRALQARLLERGDTVTLALTERPRQASEQAREATESGYAVVAVVGGDGTISECAEGLLGSECRLAVVPCGTGNDLARALGLPSDPAAAAAAIHAGKSRDLDLWLLNDRVLVNVAGVGFDAEVAAALNRTGRRVGGTAGYLLGVLTALRRFRPRAIVLRVDETEFAGRVMMVALANGPYYGGGMKIAPAADPSDGLLDVVVIQELSRLRFLSQFPRVFRGTHVTDPAVKCYRGRTITITGDADTRVMVDGEPCGTLPVQVTPAPQPLNVIVP